MKNKIKVTLSKADKIMKRMCLEGGLTIEQAERVFDMCYEIKFTAKEKKIIATAAATNQI